MDRLHNSLALHRFSIASLPWSASNRKGSGALPIALLAVIALLPAAYSAYVLRQAARRTSATASISPPDPLPVDAQDDDDDDDALIAIPPAVRAALDQYVVARERIVSEAIPLRKILPGLRAGLEAWEGKEVDGGEGDRSESVSGSVRRGLLETYLATTMRMFTWTPQALAMKHMVARLPDGAAYAGTFAGSYLDTCFFQARDRVYGVYVVRERVRNKRWERVLLDLSPPEGWKGPVVAGVLDCGFVLGEERGERVIRFVNETVLWRREDEKPTLLEGTVSRWLHGAMVGWMVVRGVEAVTGE
ncbi:hypothetical protein GGR55DRAFT_672209 [Xylaria sp. FL0064]|nr:hypothetical protein GGR55DRAFT_672209 [Xylaria sp. FL0064]